MDEFQRCSYLSPELKPHIFSCGLNAPLGGVLSSRLARIKDWTSVKPKPSSSPDLPHCYPTQVCMPDTQWGQTILKRQSLEQRQVYYIKNHARRQVALAPKPANSLKGFSKVFLKARRRRGQVGCCTLLGVGILCAPSSSHDVPINLQQNKCYSLFCNFLISIRMEKCYTLKGQSLENSYPVYFRL